MGKPAVTSCACGKMQRSKAPVLSTPEDASKLFDELSPRFDELSDAVIERLVKQIIDEKFVNPGPHGTVYQHRVLSVILVAIAARKISRNPNNDVYTLVELGIALGTRYGKVS